MKFCIPAPAWIARSRALCRSGVRVLGGSDRSQSPFRERASADAETFGVSKPRTWRIVDDSTPWASRAR
jgi:hypothetical protein